MMQNLLNRWGKPKTDAPPWMTAPGNNNFGPNSPFVSKGLHHFAKADAATCSDVVTVSRGFSSLITRLQELVIPQPKYCPQT